MRIRTVSVVGLGKVGAPLAASIASRGIEVVGFDVDRTKVDAVREGRAPVDEPGLAELIRPPLRATSNLAEAITASDMTFVAVPTPAGSDAILSAEHVRTATAAINEVLRAKRDPHVVAIASTVMPGVTATLAPPAPHAVAYIPEFVRLGSAIRDFLEPDFVLIGADSPAVALRAAELSARVATSDPKIHRTTIVEAELAKLALNGFLATKISFANTIGSLCASLGSADAGVVTAVLGSDSRIGPAFLKPGMAFGGSCLPRDTAALAALADSDGELLRAALTVNDATLDHVVARVAEVRAPGATVGICGLAFKAGTSVVDEAPGTELARRLAEGGPVLVYDPLAPAAQSNGFDVADSLDDCVRRADVLVIATDDPHLRTVTHPCVIDPWTDA